MRRFFVLLLIAVMLFVGLAQTARAEVITLTVGMIALAMIILGVSGATFMYATKDEAVGGVTGMIQGFLEAYPAYTLSKLFPAGMLEAFTLTGSLVFTDGHVWNEFMDWAKGAISQEADVVLGDNNSLIVEGITYYHHEVQSGVYPELSSCISYVIERGVKYSLFPSFPDLYMLIRSTDSGFTWYNGTKNIGFGSYNAKAYGKSVFYAVPVYYYLNGNLSVGHFYYNENGEYVGGYSFSGVTGYPDVDSLVNWFTSLVGSVGAAPPLDIPLVPEALPMPGTGDEDIVFNPPLPNYWTGAGTYEQTMEEVIEGVGTGKVSVPGIGALNPDIPINPDVPIVDDPALAESKTWGEVAPDEFKLPGLTGVFPFCIPFDLIALVGALNTRAETPIFKVPIDMSFAGYKGEFVLDLTEYEVIAAVIRWGVTIFFILGLIIVTRKMIQG